MLLPPSASTVSLPSLDVHLDDSSLARLSRGRDVVVDRPLSLHVDDMGAVQEPRIGRRRRITHSHDHQIGAAATSISHAPGVCCMSGRVGLRRVLHVDERVERAGPRHPAWSTDATGHDPPGRACSAACSAGSCDALSCGFACTLSWSPSRTRGSRRRRRRGPSNSTGPPPTAARCGAGSSPSPGVGSLASSRLEALIVGDAQPHVRPLPATCDAEPRLRRSRPMNMVAVVPLSVS